MHACVLEVMRKMLNNLLCVLMLLLGFIRSCLYIITLFILPFLYCALQAHIRCQCLTNTRLRYISKPIAVNKNKTNSGLVSHYNNVYFRT